MLIDIIFSSLIDTTYPLVWTGAILVFNGDTKAYMKKSIEITTLTKTPEFNAPETPEAKYWREKYEVSTKHLMVAVKEWGKLRQQVEEYRNKVA